MKSRVCTIVFSSTSDFFFSNLFISFAHRNNFFFDSRANMTLTQPTLFYRRRKNIWGDEQNWIKIENNLRKKITNTVKHNLYSVCVLSVQGASSEAISIDDKRFWLWKNSCHFLNTFIPRYSSICCGILNLSLFYLFHTNCNNMFFFSFPNRNTIWRWKDFRTESNATLKKML